jgi:hypothetical protein
LKTGGVEVSKGFEDELNYRSDDSDIKTKTCRHKDGRLFRGMISITTGQPAMTAKPQIQSEGAAKGRLV